MTDNLRIWNALEKTDPKHTKQFKRAGGFSGTAMKPIWLTKRLTEQFGPCGIGWAMKEPKFEVVPAGNEVLVFCTVALWYVSGEGNARQEGTVYGVGGDKVLAMRQSGPFTNDEAFKASYTDALSNAMKQIGVGADIHMGLFDDEKYVRETAREFMNPPANQTPMGEFPPDDDISAGARRWVATESGVLATLENAEDVKAWNARNAKALKKLQSNFEPEYDKIMTVYGTALGRAQARV